jgi:hypothetical protein
MVLGFCEARRFPRELVLSVFLRIPMARIQSRSYTSNEVTPGTCRARLGGGATRKQVDLRYEGDIIDDDGSSDMSGSGSDGHPCFSFGVN